MCQKQFKFKTLQKLGDSASPSSEIIAKNKKEEL